MGLLITAIAGVAVFGYAVDKVGEGIDDTGSGLLKLAVGGAILYYVVKKL